MRSKSWGKLLILNYRINKMTFHSFSKDLMKELESQELSSGLSPKVRSLLCRTDDADDILNLFYENINVDNQVSQINSIATLVVKAKGASLSDSILKNILLSLTLDYLELEVKINENDGHGEVCSGPYNCQCELPDAIVEHHSGSTSMKHLLFIVATVIYPNVPEKQSSIILFDFKIHQCESSVLPKSNLKLCYKKSVILLDPIFKLTEDFLERLSLNEFCGSYRALFDWTQNPKLFCDCFELLANKNGSDDILALLMLCGGLERALGNVYLTRANPCPGLLKDLLATQELEDILGPSTIMILQVLIGPPTSMNLRNVVWHGFLSDIEIQRRHVYFLLVLTASIGSLLLEKNMSSKMIENRSYMTLSKSDNIVTLLNVTAVDNLTELEMCVLNSWINTSNNSNTIKSAFGYFKQQQFGRCAVQLLPLMEHTMRRLFVAANQCPGRLITAEATTLYTTFEEILDYQLPDGKENALVSVLGESFLDLLHDVLIYPIGPRARDKLGHCEADYEAVPKSLPCILLFALGHLAQKGSVNVQEPLCPLGEYRSIFHPIAVLKQKIQDLSKVSEEMHLDQNNQLPTDVSNAENTLLLEIQASLLTFTQSSAIKANGFHIQDWEMFLQISVQPFQHLYETVKSIISRADIKTLYRWHPKRQTVGKVTESEIVSLLMRIITESEICLSQTKSALQLRLEQFQNKQLRSRQRDNLKTLIAFLPCLSLHVNFVIVLSTWILSHLDDYVTLEKPACKTLQRFLKSNLQTCENLRTLTSADNNKWSQAGQTALRAMKSAVSFSRENPFSQSTDTQGAVTTASHR